MDSAASSASRPPRRRPRHDGVNRGLCAPPRHLAATDLPDLAAILGLNNVTSSTSFASALNSLLATGQVVNAQFHGRPSAGVDSLLKVAYASITELSHALAAKPAALGAP